MNKVPLSKNSDYVSDYKKIFFYRSLFGRSRSRFLGKLLNINLPVPLRRKIFGFLVNNYLYDEHSYNGQSREDKIKQFEERHANSLDSYKSIGELFTRSIRPSDILFQGLDDPNSISSPCEGRVVEFGEIYTDKCVQVKSSTFKVSELLRENFGSLVDSSNLFYVTIYLSPKDYHRFHSPSDIEIKNVKHISGECFPVFKGIASKLNNLFSINERVVINSKWEHGKMYIIAVAAHGVSDIKLFCVPNLQTNQRGFGPNYLTGNNGKIVEYSNFKSCTNQGNYLKGEELGLFNLGSTIILVFQAPKDFKFTVDKGEKLKLGQIIGKVSN
ncbi:putative phosphatidylserine decarboxylase [Cryptosporidium canis]|uniref:phosphatidylserine decarboxylase n=1 Tax=Cryptosporidium canis TaxID=195482 RepID=A0ABQ8P5W9_9CRYT|nr:putative phosphatidylserine decarboxylase [Cryptosporidium canis]KAJ1614246.1 putative phosphatidylserine decarboxylase [Cryptosporidium canis]